MKEPELPARLSSSSFELNRREFGKMAVVIPLMLQTIDCASLPYNGGLTDIEGIKVGHYTFDKRATGCTVILTEDGAVAGVDVRGSAPGTRETDLLNPVNSVQKIHAIVLSGGSAFGLDTASGVVQYLEEKNIGYDTGPIRVPIVPAAILYDLRLGNPKIRPDRHSAYRACLEATSQSIPEGNVGAGAGATVGKLLGVGRAMKGGLGTASLKVGDVIVAALAAVNAVGDVIDPQTGQILAGARSEDGKSMANTMRVLQTTSAVRDVPIENTTLIVVATNAAFDKAGMTKLAQMGQDGLARAINPAHTPSDGDTVFAVSTGKVTNASLGRVGALAAEVTSQAIVRAVLTARSIPSYPAYCDMTR